MNVSERTAVLVETGGSHEACLYPQSLILSRAGYAVHLICSDHLGPRVRGIEPTIASVELVPPASSRADRRKRVEAVARAIADRRPDLAVLNTAQGKRTRDLMAASGSTVGSWIGILHRVDRLPGTLAQRSITRRIGAYLVLDDEFLPVVPRRLRPRVRAFYPIFLPPAEELPPPDPATAPPDKPAGETWITVPGGVERKRRDYDFLARLASEAAVRDVRFILLGRSYPEREEGREIRSMLAGSGHGDRFILFDGFVDQGTFHAWLRSSDLVMPLLHPRRPQYAYYRNRRVSFAVHTAAMHRKPLLADKAFASHPDYAGNSLFYDSSRKEGVLADLESRLESVRRVAFRGGKWTLEEQTSRYLAAVEIARRRAGHRSTRSATSGR